jgi:UDP-glucose 4-epimerase
MVIPRFVKSALENKPLTIFGNGSQSRVFCHVADTVKAILLLAETHDSIGQVYNIGGEGEITILDLAKLIISTLNSNSEITFTNYEDAYSIGFEDMARRVPDIAKIKLLTSWSPKISLEKIILDVSKSYS